LRSIVRNISPSAASGLQVTTSTVIIDPRESAFTRSTHAGHDAKNSSKGSHRHVSAMPQPGGQLMPPLAIGASLPYFQAWPLRVTPKSRRCRPCFPREHDVAVCFNAILFWPIASGEDS
jgi:hypothetical protein